jgi:hypothetical protein
MYHPKSLQHEPLQLREERPARRTFLFGVHQEGDSESVQGRFSSRVQEQIDVWIIVILAVMEYVSTSLVYGVRLRRLHHRDIIFAPKPYRTVNIGRRRSSSGR